MTRTELTDLYRAYIACLNAQNWRDRGDFVHENVQRNGERLGLSGYRSMLEGDFRAIPDLRFAIALLLADPPRIATVWSIIDKAAIEAQL